MFDKVSLFLTKLMENLTHISETHIWGIQKILWRLSVNQKKNLLSLKLCTVINNLWLWEKRRCEVKPIRLSYNIKVYFQILLLAWNSVHICMKFPKIYENIKLKEPINFLYFILNKSSMSLMSFDMTQSESSQ